MSILDELDALAADKRRRRLENNPFLEVDDGDTFGLPDDRNLRIEGINTPEVGHAEGEMSSPGGDAAARFAAQFASGTPELTGDQGKYGRELGDVRGEDGRLLSHELLRKGHATIYPLGSTEQQEAISQNFRLKMAGIGHITPENKQDITRYLEELYNTNELLGNRREAPRLGKYVPGNMSINALARGIDQSQQMSYGFMKTVGDIIGSDGLKKLADVGIGENELDIMFNPRSNPSVLEAKGFGGTADALYESVLEQVANLGISVGSAAGAHLLTGGASSAALVGAGVSSVALNTGETQVEFDREGIHDPWKVLGTGAAKGALDIVGLRAIPGFGKFLSRSAKKAKVSPKFAQKAVMKDVPFKVVKTAAIEGSTEAMQTVLDKVSVNSSLGRDWSSHDTDEVLESMIVGAATGGITSGISASAMAGMDVAKTKNLSDNPWVEDEEVKNPKGRAAVVKKNTNLDKAVVFVNDGENKGRMHFDEVKEARAFRNDVNKNGFRAAVENAGLLNTAEQETQEAETAAETPAQETTKNPLYEELATVVGEEQAVARVNDMMDSMDKPVEFQAKLSAIRDVIVKGQIDETIDPQESNIESNETSPVVATRSIRAMFEGFPDTTLLGFAEQLQNDSEQNIKLTDTGFTLNGGPAEQLDVAHERGLIDDNGAPIEFEQKAETTEAKAAAAEIPEGAELEKILPKATEAELRQLSIEKQRVIDDYENHEGGLSSSPVSSQEFKIADSDAKAIALEQYKRDEGKVTTTVQESDEDIAAQFSDLKDGTSPRNAVYVADPKINNAASEARLKPKPVLKDMANGKQIAVHEVIVNKGQKGRAYFLDVKKAKAYIEQIKESNVEAANTVALGHATFTPKLEAIRKQDEENDPMIVAQVRNPDGTIAFETLTNESEKANVEARLEKQSKGKQTVTFSSSQEVIDARIAKREAAQNRAKSRKGKDRETYYKRRQGIEDRIKADKPGLSEARLAKAVEKELRAEVKKEVAEKKLAKKIRGAKAKQVEETAEQKEDKRLQKIKNTKDNIEANRRLQGKKNKDVIDGPDSGKLLDFDEDAVTKGLHKDAKSFTEEGFPVMEVKDTAETSRKDIIGKARSKKIEGPRESLQKRKARLQAVQDEKAKKIKARREAKRQEALEEAQKEADNDDFKNAPKADKRTTEIIKTMAEAGALEQEQRRAYETITLLQESFPELSYDEVVTLAENEYYQDAVNPFSDKALSYELTRDQEGISYEVTRDQEDIDINGAEGVKVKRIENQPTKDKLKREATLILSKEAPDTERNRELDRKEWDANHKKNQGRQGKWGPSAIADKAAEDLHNERIPTSPKDSVPSGATQKPIAKAPKETRTAEERLKAKTRKESRARRAGAKTRRGLLRNQFSRKEFIKAQKRMERALAKRLNKNGVGSITRLDFHRMINEVFGKETPMARIYQQMFINMPSVLHIKLGSGKSAINLKKRRISIGIGKQKAERTGWYGESFFHEISHGASMFHASIADMARQEFGDKATVAQLIQAFKKDDLKKLDEEQQQTLRAMYEAKNASSLHLAQEFLDAFNAFKASGIGSGKVKAVIGGKEVYIADVTNPKNLASVTEFIATGTSNADVMEILNGIKMPGGASFFTVFRQIINAIKDYFGFTDNSILHQLFASTVAASADSKTISQEVQAKAQRASGIARDSKGSLDETFISPEKAKKVNASEINKNFTPRQRLPLNKLTAAIHTVFDPAKDRGAMIKSKAALRSLFEAGVFVTPSNLYLKYAAPHIQQRQSAGPGTGAKDKNQGWLDRFINSKAGYNNLLEELYERHGKVELEAGFKAFIARDITNPVAKEINGEIRRFNQFLSKSSVPHIAEKAKKALKSKIQDFPQVHDKEHIRQSREEFIKFLTEENNGGAFRARDHLGRPKLLNKKRAAALVDSMIVSPDSETVNLHSRFASTRQQRIIDPAYQEKAFAAGWLNTDVRAVLEGLVAQGTRQKAFEEEWGGFRKQGMDKKIDFLMKHGYFGLEGSQDNIEYAYQDAVSRGIIKEINSDFFEGYDSMQERRQTLKALEAKKGPAVRNRVEKVMNGQDGVIGLDRDPAIQNGMRWLAVVQALAILPFNMITSLPEPAIMTAIMMGKNPKATFKGWGKFVMDTAAYARSAGKEGHGTMTMARRMGVIMDSLVAAAYMDDTLSMSRGRNPRIVMEKFFKYNGGMMWNNMTRAVTYNIATEHFLDAAKIVSSKKASKQEVKLAKEELAKFQVTAEEVLAWEREGRPTFKEATADQIDDVQKVATAMLNFVDSANPHPTSTVKSSMGNNADWLLIHQLKGFYYSYGMVIMPTFYRVSKEAYSRARTQDKNHVASAIMAAVPSMMILAAAMPLAMLSQVLKSEIKELTDDDRERNYENYINSMSPEERFIDILRASGATGPIDMVLGITEAGKYGGSGLARAAGPTVQHLETLLKFGVLSPEFWKRTLPGQTVVTPGLWKESIKEARAERRKKRYND